MDGRGVLCLAIATGANSAAFSLVNGLLLRPLPFDDPDRLVMVAFREPLTAGTRPFALREYRELSTRSGDVTPLLARTFFPLSLSAADSAQMAQAELVSGNYFAVLRVKPFAGRFFDVRADRPDGPWPGVLSHALWRRRFDADPHVIGRSMRVNGRPMIVVGIAPPDFVGAMRLVAADLWLPAAVYPDLAHSADAETVPIFGVMGRLAPDETTHQAEARLTSMAADLPRAGAAANPPAVIVRPATGFGVPVAIEGTVLTLSASIYVMMALLMTVACANVAALVLARATSRTREIAIRLGLGASRLDVGRQLLTESLVLALAGCAAGSAVALWLTQALVSRLTTPFQHVSYAIDVHPDVRVFVYCAILTALAAVLCGVAPVRHAARVDVVDLIKQAGAPGASRRSRWTFNAMVVVQFAVSTILLVGAGMLVRTYLHARSAASGFETSGVIAATIDADQIGLDRSAGVRLYEELVGRLSALPRVAAVSLTRDVPLRQGRGVTVTADAGGASTPDTVTATAMVVSPRFFQSVGVPILEGRAFSGVEPAHPPAALVSETLARRLWPGASPLGRTFRVTGEDRQPIEVIGTVPDPTHPSVSQGPRAAFYQPFPQEFSPRMTVLISVVGDPAPVVSQVRQTIRRVNPDLAVVDLRMVDEVLAEADAQRRIPATVLSLVGLLGLLLGAVGLYGVVAYGVRQRAHELGIRLALGARPSDVNRLVLRQGGIIVGLGLAIGAVGVVAVARLAQSTLFGIAPIDVPTVALVCAVLSAAGIAALYLPARWASRIDPARTLRGE